MEDIASLFRESPITSLNTEHQSRLLDSIRDNFTTAEQRVFVASSYCFLSHHPTNDFVVDLDGIWQWLGYTQKSSARHKLEQHFQEGIDFEHVRTEHHSGQGGHNKQVIMLNVDTFKAMCLLAGTARGAELRRYYLRMESLLQQVIAEQAAELQQQVEQQAGSLQALEDKLRDRGRRFRGAAKRETVYIYGDADPMRHKIGSSADVSAREGASGTFNCDGEMRAAIACPSADVLEKLVHVVLDEYRIDKRREWFRIDLAFAKTAVEACHRFIEHLMQSPDNVSTALTWLRGRGNKAPWIMQQCSSDADAQNSIESLHQRVRPTRNQLMLAEDTTRLHENLQLAHIELQKQQEITRQLEFQLQLAAAPETQGSSDAQVILDPLPARKRTRSHVTSSVTVRFTVPAPANHGKAIAQYNLDGSLKKEWPSAEAVRAHGDHGKKASVISNIRNCAKGAQKTAFGYVWKEIHKLLECEWEYREDGVYRQLRPDGSLVNSYAQLTDAAHASKTAYGRMCRAFDGEGDGKGPTFKGYIWQTQKVKRRWSVSGLVTGCAQQ